MAVEETESDFLPHARASPHGRWEDGKRHHHLDDIPEYQTASGSCITHSNSVIPVGMLNLLRVAASANLLVRILSAFL